MTVVDWTQFFRNHRTFRRLSETEIARLVAPPGSEERSYTAGEPIIRQGESGDTLFFLGKGAASVSITGPDGQELALARLASGDFFGELALLGDRPRSATVKSSGDCVALELKASTFLAVLHQHPDIFSEMLLVLSERLRVLAERVIAVAYDEVNDKMKLFGAKLDAELRAMNASLMASKTMFEQTAARVHEVITSTEARAHEVIATTERVWSRLTWFGSAVAFAGSIVAALLGWMGFTSINEIKDSAKQVAQQAKEAEMHATNIRNLEDSLTSGAAAVLFPDLLGKVLSGGYGEADFLTAKKLIGVVMRKQEMTVTTRVFSEIYKRMVTSDYQTKDIRDKYRDILSYAIENSDDWKMSPRDVTLSYYLILASLVIDDQLDEYIVVFAKLEYYIQHNKKPLITEKDNSDYEPLGFAAYIDDNIVDAKKAGDMKRKLEGMWNQIAAR